MGVATAIAIGGLAMTAGSTVASAIQAGKQKKAQAQAEQDAIKAMAEVRKKLEVNYMDKLAVQKEPYELQMEAALVQGSEAIQAGREQERGAAATAGRVQMAMNEMGADIRTAMGKELSDIEKLKVQEQSRLRDIGVQVDLGEVEGQQQMAADAQAAAAAATNQAWEGVTSMGQQALQLVPLYAGEGTGKTRQEKKIEKRMISNAKNAEPAQKISAPIKGIPDSSLKLKPMSTGIMEEEYDPFGFLNNPYLYKR
jgi:hypothetical protein